MKIIIPLLAVALLLLVVTACGGGGGTSPKIEPQELAPRFDAQWETYDRWYEERPYCYAVQGYDGDTSYYDEYGNYEGECINEEELKRIENEGEYYGELNSRPSPY